MKKILKIFVLIFVILAACLVLFKNVVARIAVSSTVKTLTGLKLSIKDMNINIRNTFIEIDGMKLYNPEGFTDRLMVDMPQIYIDYDLPAILKGNVHLEEVRINLRELMVVKNKNGELNLDSLKVVKESKKEKESQAVKEASKKTNFKIDVLELKIGRVIYKDYSKDKEPEVKEYKVNIDEKYKNITDIQALGRLIIIRALMNTNLEKLGNIPLNAFKKTIGGVSKTKGVVEGLGGKAAETIKKILPLVE